MTTLRARQDDFISDLELFDNWQEKIYIHHRASHRKTNSF